VVLRNAFEAAMRNQNRTGIQHFTGAGRREMQVKSKGCEYEVLMDMAVAS
jgi:hypothetical protein